MPMAFVLPCQPLHPDGVLPHHEEDVLERNARTVAPRSDVGRTLQDLLHLYLGYNINIG